MYKICVATTVHYAFDTRIYFKQVRSLSESNLVDYYAQECSGGAPEPSGMFIPLYSANSKLGRLKTNYNLFSLLWKSDYNIYHFHDPELLFLSIILKLKRKTIIFDMHEDVSKQIINKEWIPLILRRILSYIFSKIEKVLPHILDYIIVAEDSYTKKYEDIPNIEVIHNFPFKQQHYKKDYRFATFNMVYLGNIRIVRGMEECLKIVKIAKDNNLNIKLIIIGYFADKVTESRYYQLIQMYDINDNIILYNRLPNDKVYKILRDCSLGLAILHPIKNYMGSYPTKLFEYMSVGLPVIASNFDLWRKIIDESNCGYTVNPFDTKSAFRIVKRYYEDTHLLKTHGENGVKAIESKYNWEVEKGKLFKVYVTLVNDNR